MALRTHEIYTDPRFLAGLALRLAAIALLTPYAQAEAFLPFMVSTLSMPSLDPWSAFLQGGGAPSAFPFGPVMYLVHVPTTGLGMLADAVFGTPWRLARLGFSIPSLVADGLMILVLRRMHHGGHEQIVLYYWLSPVVLFVTYWLGMIDIVAMLFVFAALLMIKESRPYGAGIAMGLAVAAKVETAIVVPFLLIFLWNPRYRALVAPFAGAACATALLLLGPCLLLSPGWREMHLLQVFGALFDLRLPVGGAQYLYVLPVAYTALLYWTWQAGRMSFSLLYVFLGVAYFLSILLMPGSIATVLWLVPFLLNYRLEGGSRGRLLIVAFSLLFVAHGLLVTAAPVPGLLGADARIEAQALFGSAGWRHAASLLLSVLTAVGAILAIVMFRRGLRENDLYLLSQRPLAIGIAGDSGTGKDTLALALAGVFGENAVASISGDDYHLFERTAPLWQAMTHLDPRANDLHGYTRDALALIAWRPIHARHYDHATGLFTPRRRVQAKDVILVSGLHALYPPELRERLHVSVYLEMDEQLRRFFKTRRDVTQRGHSLDRVLASIERRRHDYERFIQPQRDHADIIFALAAADPRFLSDHTYEGELPFKLRIGLRRPANYDALARLLVALCGAEVDVNLTGGDPAVELTVAGDDVRAEDLQFTATQLVPHVEELLARSPSWLPGVTGIMQLVVLLQLSDTITKRRWGT